jgi:DNA-binding response OmpR family regulator
MALTHNGSRKGTIQFTQKERELLELLESHPGRCFSRSYLLKTIWGYADATRTRTVDVHVSRLRKKLRGRRNVSIHSVVRQGYVFQDDSAGSAAPQFETPIGNSADNQFSRAARGAVAAAG